MTSPGGYGRYGDDLGHVGCPRAQTDMTPCIARDGSTALADVADGYGQTCVGCNHSPRVLFAELAREVGRGVNVRMRFDEAADRLRDLVREVTGSPEEDTP